MGIATPIGRIERGLEISNPICGRLEIGTPSGGRHRCGPSQDLRVRRAIKPNRSGRGNEVREGQRGRCRGGLSRCRGAQNQTQGRQWRSIRPRGAADGLVEHSKPQGGRPGGMVMVAHHPTLSINLLPLRGNAPELEVSGRWGSKFLGLLQRLPYLPYIGQKLPLI